MSDPSSPAPPAGGMPALYQGFSPRFRLWIVIGAALIAIANLVGAWYMAFETSHQMGFQGPEIEQVKVLSGSLTDTTTLEANRFHLRTFALETQAHLENFKSKQQLVVLAIGSGFALFAIGFALFVLGVDGAFSVDARSATSSLMFSSAAPGLLCFVLATILIGIGLTRKIEFTPGSPSYQSPQFAFQSAVSATDETSGDTAGKQEFPGIQE